MKGEFLSDIIDTKDIVQGKLNLINAPCGCGKTTFAKTKLKRLNPNQWKWDMLYLIDTAVGKEQLLHGAGAKFEINPWTDLPQWRMPGITIMTYAGYATLHLKAPDRDLWDDGDYGALIVCDELQSPIEWSKWEKNEDGENLHEIAVNLIKERIAQENTIVVALSATPSKIKKEFGCCLNEIELHGEPRHYESENVHRYSNLSLLLNQFDIGQTGIVYVPHITQIKECQGILDTKGLTTSAIWSLYNEKHPMTQEQLDVREDIIEWGELPGRIDVLFINKSCETSINIGSSKATSNKIDFMVVHSTDEETQIQVRGRYRNDLKDLYLLDTNAIDKIELSDRWLGVPLYSEDKKHLCQILGLKDKSNSRPQKWTTVKALLMKNGYTVTDGRTNQRRYSIISEDE